MSKKRFQVIYTQRAWEGLRILRNNETGVLYMQNHRGGGVGLTVMVDQKGNPLVDEGF